MNIKDILFENQPKLSVNERVALKNVLTVCKERLWLQETGGQLDPFSDEFDSIMTEQQISGAKQSIRIMEELLHNEDHR